MDLAALQGTDGWTLRTFLDMTNANWNYHNYCAHGGSKNSILSTDSYHIAEEFGREKVSWINCFFQAFGEKKFGELIDQQIGYQL